MLYKRCFKLWHGLIISTLAIYLFLLKTHFFLTLFLARQYKFNLKMATTNLPTHKAPVGKGIGWRGRGRGLQKGWPENFKPEPVSITKEEICKYINILL